MNRSNQRRNRLSKYLVFQRGHDVLDAARLIQSASTQITLLAGNIVNASGLFVSINIVLSAKKSEVINMAIKVGYADGYKNLLTALRGFLCSAKMAHNIAADAGNAGTGYVSAERAGAAPVDETWTLTATSSTNFTVTGSVSGAQDAATVGTPYDNGIVAFTIVAGSTAFEADDEFTFAVADGLGAIQAYTEVRYNNNYDGAGEYETILMGPGTAGDDEIYTAIQTVSSAGDDYYNWRLMGMTGYSDVAMQYMPGITQGRLPRMLMWNEKIKYWFAANGRRYIVVAKISSVYESMYMGFPLPFGLPTQFPYPLVVGGAACPSTTAAYHRFSSMDYNHSAFPSPYAGAAGVIPTGTFDTTNYYSTLKVLQGAIWNRVKNKKFSPLHENIVWPYDNGVAKIADIWQDALRENPDGSRSVYPTIISLSVPDKDIVGVLQGVCAVPGFGGIAAEDRIVVEGDTYVAFPIVPNADRSDFWALKLE
jgi:hypothetical protein